MAHLLKVKSNCVKFILVLIFKKFNTNFYFDSFRDKIKLKADAVNNLQKVCGKKEEELKSVPKFFAPLLKSVAASEPRGQLKSFIVGIKPEEKFVNIKYILGVFSIFQKHKICSVCQVKLCVLRGQYTQWPGTLALYLFPER